MIALAAGAAVVCVVPARDAAACSCVRIDARRELARADGAFVGRLVSKRVASPPLRSTADDAIYTFEVDESIKGAFGRRVEIVSAAEGASCGIESEVGKPIGLLLAREGGAWRSNLCLQVTPAELRAAARPLPRPTSRKPTALVVGGTFGEARLVALDSDGRTVAYGLGSGRTVLMAVCPGGQRLIEVVMPDFGAPDDGDRRVVVRLVRGLRVVRQVKLQSGGRRAQYPRAVACLDRAAARIALFTTDGYDEPQSRLLVVRSRVTTIWRGSAHHAAFAAGSAYLGVAAPAGRIVAVDLSSRKRRTAATLPGAATEFSVSPDGKRLAAPVSDGPVRPPSRLVVIDLAGRRRQTRSRSVDDRNSGRLLWLDAERLAYAGAELIVYDTRLRRVARVPEWYAADPVALGRSIYGIGYDGRVRRATPGAARPTILATLPSPTASAIVPVSTRTVSRTLTVARSSAYCSTR